jgi:C4-dicarboxylate-specific signal transduction histidine kinase
LSPEVVIVDRGGYKGVAIDGVKIYHPGLRRGITRAGYRVRNADPELLQIMTSVGSQIGQFIERTRTEDALRQAREKLAQASRMATVAELSASIAHEINQPAAGPCGQWAGLSALARRNAAKHRQRPT